MILRDKLALERTKLANERTFMAYFRTFIVLISSGVAIIRLEFLRDIIMIGYLFLIIAPITLLVGLIRLKVVKNRLKNYYEMDQ